jgi:hypothetical protein
MQQAIKMSLAECYAYLPSTFLVLPDPGYGAGKDTQPGMGFLKAHFCAAVRVKMAQVPPHQE